MNGMSAQDIRIAAVKELDAENRRLAIEAEKLKIKEERNKKSFWHKLMPFVITIKRR